MGHAVASMFRGCCTALWQWVWPFKKLPHAQLTRIRASADQGGHVVMKSSFTAPALAFRYHLQVFIFFPQELFATTVNPYQHIWQSIRDLQPDSTRAPDLACAEQTRSRIRAAAKRALHEGPSGSHASKGVNTGICSLLEEACRLQSRANFGAPSLMEEHMFVELERAMMRTYDALPDARLLGSLQQLLARHQERGYLDTLAVSERAGDEGFTQRLKELKRQVRKPVTISYMAKQPNNLMADLIGAVIAGLAMAWAIFTLFIGWKIMGGPNAGIKLNFAGPFIVVTVVGYMLKDRIKVWGQRYIGSIARWLHIFWPDHTSHLCNHEMVKVGTCEALCKTTTPASLCGSIRSARRMARKEPGECVISFVKRCSLDLSRAKGACTGSAVQDIMTVDLSFLSRKMQPSHEDHWLFDVASRSVVKVAFPRVYHVNLVIAAGSNGNRVMQRHRAILDRDRLLRVEAVE